MEKLTKSTALRPLASYVRYGTVYPNGGNNRRGKTMNKIMRTLTMAGLGLLAGASIGAPALAADSGTTTAKKPSGAQTQQLHGRDYVAGFYRNLGTCRRAGAVGDWAGKWDNPRCYPVRVGFRRG